MLNKKFDIKLSNGPSLEDYIKKYQAMSFLDQNAEMMRTKKEDVERVNAVLGDYAQRQNLANNILGLIPTPGARMQARMPPKPPQTQNFNPGSLAVVPPALKFLRKLATRNKKEHDTSLEPIFEFPQVGRLLTDTDEFPRSFTNKIGENFRTDKLLTKGGKPIALLALEPRQKTDYDNYMIGDEIVSRQQYKNLIDKLTQNFKQRYEERLQQFLKDRKEYPEFESLTSFPFFNKDNYPVKHSVHLDVNYPSGASTLASTNKNADTMDKFNTRGIEVDPKSILRDPQKMEPYRYNVKSQNPGVFSVRQMLPVIKSLYPKATEVSGARISGAKEKNNKSNKKQTIKLPNLTEAQMLKQLGLYKKPLHYSIQNRKPGDVKNYIPE